MKVTRSGFLKIFGASFLALVFRPFSSALAQAKKLAIPLAKAEKVKQVGGWAVLQVKDQKILFVREAETSIRAFDPICTHQQCEVAYSAADKNLHCPCHHSTFDLTGKLLSGPAPAPLKTYPASLNGDKIIVEV